MPINTQADKIWEVKSVKLSIVDKLLVMSVAFNGNPSQSYGVSPAT